MLSAVQNFAYQLLLRLLLPLFFFQGYKQDRQRWAERLGYSNQKLPLRPIWLHAASYGEAKAAGLLIQAIRDQGYRGSWLVTTTTRTGGEAIRSYLTESDLHLYAPFDLPSAIRRLLRQVEPSALLVMEVELWPNLWRICQQRKIPIVLANARLSETSVKRYKQLLPRLWKNTLNRATKILAQSDAIAERYARLGVDREKIQVCGNLKYNLQVDPAIEKAGEQLRLYLGGERPVWLAASTHAEEEQLVINCHKKLLEDYPDLLLVIAPRHPQRFDGVWQLCAGSGLSAVRRSGHSKSSLANTVQLFLADTLGELLAFYAACDLCLVAGSFVNVGGHNILEPASYGCPVIVGPDMKNFADINREFVAQNALEQVPSSAELYPRVKLLLEDKQRCTRLAAQAKACLNQYQDAAKQQAQVMTELLYPEDTNLVVSEPLK
tara:strand:+ start:93 stop:1400 length:1308 start_codon:yes stop_codon:yes gene_type:complete